MMFSIGKAGVQFSPPREEGGDGDNYFTLFVYYSQY